MEHGTQKQMQLSLVEEYSEKVFSFHFNDDLWGWVVRRSRTSFSPDNADEDVSYDITLSTNNAKTGTKIVDINKALNKAGFPDLDTFKAYVYSKVEEYLFNLVLDNSVCIDKQFGGRPFIFVDPKRGIMLEVEKEPTKYFS